MNVPGKRSEYSKTQWDPKDGYTVFRGERERRQRKLRGESVIWENGHGAFQASGAACDQARLGVGWASSGLLSRDEFNLAEGGDS